MFIVELKNGEYVVHKSAAEIRRAQRMTLWRSLLAIRPKEVTRDVRP